MGILNVTPDSFSDGGVHFSFQDAVDAAERMVEEGADIIDVGGESTRPGSEGVALDEELRRTIPVVEALAAKGIAVSIDTLKPVVAARALEVGASVVNDVSGLRDPLMMELVKESGCTVCIMHMQGEPRTMQQNPTYGDVVTEVRDYLVGQASALEKERVWLDPGIGFGKTVEHNLALLNGLDVLVETGYPVLIGVSRKSFLGKLLGGLPADERLEGTLAAQVVAQMKGAKIIRAHDVKEARRAIEITKAITLSPSSKRPA